MKQKKIVTILLLLVMFLFIARCGKVSENRGVIYDAALESKMEAETESETNIKEESAAEVNGESGIESTNDTEQLYEEYTINASQCLWGTWKITQGWSGGRGFQECEVEDEKKNMEITFLPRQCCFGDTAVQIDHYASRLIAVSDESIYNHAEYSRSLGMKGNYALEVEASDTEKELFLPFSYVVLISDREMIVFNGREMHKAIKIEDQEVEEDIGFNVWESRDVCNGKWKITEEISLKRDSEIHVGDIVEVRVLRGLRRKRWTGDVPYCRVFSLNDDGIKELARSFAISDSSSLMVCYEFAEDFGWDKMIVKDAMNVILVKGDAYYLAKRISDVEEDGIYKDSF